MVDTLNVSREWVERFVKWVEGFTGTVPEATSDEMFGLYTEARRALLAPSIEEMTVMVCKGCGSVRNHTNQCDCSLHNGATPDWEAVVLRSVPRVDGISAYTRQGTMREILDRQLSDTSRRLTPEIPKRRGVK